MPRQAAAPPPPVAFPLAGNRQTTNKEKNNTAVLPSNYSKTVHPSISASRRKRCLPGEARGEFINSTIWIKQKSDAG